MIATAAWGSSFMAVATATAYCSTNTVMLRASGVALPGRVTVPLFLSTASSFGLKGKRQQGKQDCRHQPPEKRLDPPVARRDQPRQAHQKKHQGHDEHPPDRLRSRPQRLRPLPDQVGQQRESPERGIGEDAGGYLHRLS